MQVIRDVIGQFAEFVTTYNRLVIVLMLVLTAGVALGLTQDQGAADQEIDDDAGGDSEVMQAAEYIDERYDTGNESEGNVTTADVYLLTDDGSALTRESLLAALEYQQTVLEDSDELVADDVDGAPSLIATQLTGDPAADLETQYGAIESASDEELEAAITTTFARGEETAFYLPTTYEAGSAESDAFRMTFTVEEGSLIETQETLDEVAGEYESTTLFVSGGPAFAELSETFFADSAWLVIPSILVVLLVILGFAYRDVTDVILGFTGTLFALLWTAGLMGWMGLLNQQTAIIAPVLVAALSIDFGFHVFMRYRENRTALAASETATDTGIRAALSRSTAAVTVAFLLVTVTAAIGFLSNQFSPVGVIRELGVAITLGVVAALVIFTTLVPALKVSADGLWERFGFDRHKTALGKGTYLRRVLATGATVAQRGALVVIAVALIAGVAGGLAFGELDREAWQDADFHDDPGWQSSLPGPMAFEAHESDIAQQMAYVQNNFQSDQESITDGGSGFTTMLVEGDDVATPAAMDTLASGHEAATEADSSIVFQQNGDVQVVSPLSMMAEVAAQDSEFAATLDRADTTNDGVPDSNIEALLDEFFATAPDAANQVIERGDDGSYESMRLLVPAQQEVGPDRADVMYDIADEMAADSEYAVTAVGVGTLNDAEMAGIAESIVWTLLLALGGVLVTLALVYRLVHRSFSLGVVTVVPVALALGLVFGGMYLAGQPLTMLTALLVSITIGLGIDYNIHVSDRFAQELERGRETATALREAVTGTGGALLGSAVTSGGAFSLLVILPHPQFNSFGFIVALALGVSFVLSVFVLPSLLWLWARYGNVSISPAESAEVAAADD